MHAPCRNLHLVSASTTPTLLKSTGARKLNVLLKRGVSWGVFLTKNLNISACGSDILIGPKVVDGLGHSLPIH